MVGKRCPASWRKRFRFLVSRAVATNSCWLVSEEPEPAMSMSPGGSECRRSCDTVKNLARQAIAATADAEANEGFDKIKYYFLNFWLPFLPPSIESAA
jgi:hypothetical protein